MEAALEFSCGEAANMEGMVLRGLLETDCMVLALEDTPPENVMEDKPPPLDIPSPPRLLRYRPSLVEAEPPCTGNVFLESPSRSEATDAVDTLSGAARAATARDCEVGTELDSRMRPC